jgi:hypothetical protein
LTDDALKSPASGGFTAFSCLGHDVGESAYAESFGGPLGWGCAKRAQIVIEQVAVGAKVIAIDSCLLIRGAGVILATIDIDGLTVLRRRRHRGASFAMKRILRVPSHPSRAKAQRWSTNHLPIHGSLLDPVARWLSRSSSRRQGVAIPNKKLITKVSAINSIVS